MFEIVVIALANLIVGGLIGICGIAGFLLPMMYAGVLNLPVTDSLTLSFLAFLVSGIIGSYNYHKKGNLDVGFSIRIGIGSFIGALFGVKLNLLIPQETVKLLLYIVVLLSGISILLKKDKSSDEGEEKKKGQEGVLENTFLVLLLGLVTGTICSLSGAGGPILVMPLLVSMGMNIRTAVGVSLFDSVFIAFPAFIGYMSKSSGGEIWMFAVVCVIAHAAGVILGSTNAHRIKQRPLKMGVAVFSIGIALYMIVGLLV